MTDNQFFMKLCFYEIVRYRTLLFGNVKNSSSDGFGGRRANSISRRCLLRVK